MTQYEIKLNFDTINFLADLTRAEAPIKLLTCDDDLDEASDTQYQTADARHDAMEAAILVIRSMGRDYYMNPADDEPENEEEYIRGLIQSVN